MRLLAPLALGCALVAQQNVVSPRSLASTEGNSYHWALLSQQQSRFQQVESSLRGAARSFVAIAFRRDATQGGGASRTASVDLWIAHGDRATFSNVFGSNFKGTPAIAYTQKPINLPDWTTKPTTPPAPFTVTLPFDQPWAYSGQDDLVWDFSCYSSSIAGYDLYPVDRGYTHWTYGATLSLGAGCTTTNGKFTIGADSRASLARWDLALTFSGAPSSAPLALLIGTTDLNFPVPGLCTNLRPLVAATVAIATSDAGGAASATLLFGFSLDMADFPVLLQAAAPDATQGGLPFAASQGLFVRTPPGLGGPLVEGAYTYDTTNASASIGSGPHSGAVVARFTY